MRLAQFFAIIKAARWSIVMMVIIGSGVAWALAASLPKEYTAKARVMLNVGNTDPNQMSAVTAKTEDNYINTEMRLVTDDAVMHDAVDKLGWASDPQVVASWQAATGGAGSVDKWLAHILASNIAVQRLEDSSIVEIYYSASSLDAAKQIVAAVRVAYIDNSLHLRSVAARRASAWNATKAAMALVDLQRAETERAKFAAANQIAIDSSMGSAEMRELTAARNDSLDTETRAKMPNSSPQVARLRSRLDALDAELAVAKLRGADNPTTVGITIARDQAAAQLTRETSFVQAGSSATDSQVAADRQLRGNQYLAARLRVLDRAPVYDRMAQYDRDVALKTSLYTAAAKRVESFDTVAAAPSGMNVIGDVIADDDPVYPNILLAVALAAAASLGLGISVALLSEMLRQMVRSTEDLRFYSQVPVLAVIAGDPPSRRRRSVRRQAA